MSIETTPAPGSGTRAAIGLALAFILLAAGGGAGLVGFLRPAAGPDTTGLDGVWVEEKNPKHLYKLGKGGTLLWKTKALVLGDLVWDTAGTWKRDGSKITILPNRNWKVEGELMDDGTIRGKMYSLPDGDALGDVVWRRE